MKTLKVIFFFFLIPLFCFPNARAVPRENNSSPTARIAAVVNDSSILSSELDARLRLVAITSGLSPKSPELKEQVLKIMINEMLQLQQAKKFDIDVTKEEIEETYKDLEQRNGMAPGDLDRFLNQHHIPKSTLTQQIRSNLAWQRYIQDRYQPTIQVSDREVESVLHQIQKRKAQPHFLLAEIVLAVENPSKEHQVLRDANKLYQQLQHGANFSMLAQQFSEAPSKAHGGDIGWLALTQLDPEIQAAIKNLKSGGFSPPIRTSSGYVLLLLRDRRDSAKDEEGETLVSFQQALFPVTPSLMESQKVALFRQIQALSRNSKSCVMFEKLAKGIPSTQIKTVNKMPLSEINPPSLRSMLAQLKEGQTSEPIETEAGILLFSLCTKEKEATNEPNKDAILRTLVSEKLTLIAQRELRNLQRVAWIDIRE